MRSSDCGHCLPGSSVRREARRHIFIEVVDKGVLVRTGVGPEGFGAFDQDFIGIGRESRYGLRDETDRAALPPRPHGYS
jgi:hypothetical protein